MEIPFFRKKKRKTGPGKPTVTQKSGLFSRLLLALVIVIALTYIYISLASRRADWVEYSFPALNAGDITIKREIAPFDFDVPKSERQLEDERDDAARNVLPVFRLDETVFMQASSQVDTLFSIIDSLSQEDIADSARVALLLRVPQVLPDTLLASFIEIVNSGDASVSRTINRAMKESFGNISELLIVSSTSYMRNITSDLFMLDQGDTVSIEMTIEVDEASNLVITALENGIDNVISDDKIGIVKNVVNSFLKPNVIYDNNLTAVERRKARDAVPINAASFKMHERIIDANVPVTRQQLEVLEALKGEIARRSFIENRWQHYSIAIGKTINGLGILGIITGFIFLYRRRTFQSFSHLLLLVLISSLPVIVAYYAALSGRIPEFLIPVAIASILVTILFNAELGIIVTLGISLIVSSFFSGSMLRIGFIYFLSGCIGGVFTVGHVRHRKEFYRSMVFVPLVMIVSIATTNDWIAHTAFTDVGYDIFLGALNGFLCPIIAIGLLPLLESLFKVSTDITLLELSDFNNPLLKELAIQAPGTYSSVIIVGTLAETAAEKIGANSLLCRVGSYYHDIGKMVNPHYFIENQMESDNPHDHLTAHMSALVILSHVKEGYELGFRHGLPQDILDIIQQHHGTSLLESIYHRAEEEADSKPVDKSAFRYPGPKPQTREAGIVMLADLVEAASRSVKEKSMGRLKSLINTIIQKRFIDGELDECDLTLKDLHNIEESFLPVLVGSHHGRIEYPWQKEENGTDIHHSAKTDVKGANKIERGGNPGKR